MSYPPIPFLSQSGPAEQAVWIQALSQAMPQERIVSFSALSEQERNACTMAIVANPDPAQVHALTSLQWVHSVWAGVERLVASLGDSPLHIVRLVDPQLAANMAEAVLAWTLYLHRYMPEYARQQQQRIWAELPYVMPQHRTIGILGMGELGTEAARRLRAADFRVCGWSRRPRSIEGVESFAGDDGLREMLAQTDILVCLLPLTPQTRHLLDAERLGWLPRGARLINFARGGIIDDTALHAALDAGHLAHAVLDVFEVEPPPVDGWHWAHPGVTVLPHCSGPTSRETASAIVARHVQAFRERGELPAGVDRAAGY